jgi:hypothetical protein
MSAVPLELGYLTFCFSTSNSVAFLDLSNELIALSFDDLPVIVGQSSPGLLAFPANCFQLPLIWSVFIWNLQRNQSCS